MGYKGFAGSDTQYVEDLKWEFADDVEKFFQESERYFVRFASLLYEKAQMRGYTGDPEDVQALTDFVHRRVVDTGGTLSKMTIRNWLCKSKPVCSASSRDNVYQLCFALEMDEQEAYLFFVKVYWDHPFDFRQMDECVYWYCLKNRLTYTRAKRILEEVQEIKTASAAPFQEMTTQLGAGLERCEDERSLVEYLAANRDSFEERGVTAKREIGKLLEQCADRAQKRIALRNPTGKKDGKRFGNGSVLAEIYGFHPRSKQKAASDGGKTAADKNFPREYHLQQILGASKVQATYESMRRVLILLCFYEFWASYALSDETIKSYAEQGNSSTDEPPKDDEPCDQFRAGMDELLYRCGFGPLYPRNPDENIFIGCAVAEEPLDAFQNYAAAHWMDDEGEE